MIERERDSRLDGHVCAGPSVDWTVKARERSAATRPSAAGVSSRRELGTWKSVEEQAWNGRILLVGRDWSQNEVDSRYLLKWIGP